MATYYAWTQILGADDKGKPVAVKRGDKVTASQLHVTTEEFQAMIDSGAVRTKQYPAPEDYKGSAVDYLREQLREATSVSDESIEEAEAVNNLSQLEKVAG